MPHSPAATLVRPTPEGYSPRVQGYLSLVPAGTDPLVQLRQQAAALQQQFATLTEALALLRYAPGKWTPKQVLLHIADAERIFTYRALRFARADAQELPGFDENEYAASSEADDRPLPELLAEYQAVRAATLAFFGGLNGGQLDRAGRASGSPYTVRALLYLAAGHEAHHLRVLAERYWPLLQASATP